MVVGRAKSNRAKCTCCQRLIPVGDVRYGGKFQVQDGQSGIKYKHLRCVSDKQLVNWHAMGWGENLPAFYAQSAAELDEEEELDEEGKRAFEAVFLDKERIARIDKEGPVPSTRVRDGVLHLGSSEDAGSAASHEASARMWCTDGLFLRPVSELRDMCRALGVKVTGVKADLVQRVRMASESEGLAAPARAGEGPSKAGDGPSKAGEGPSKAGEGDEGAAKDGDDDQLDAGLVTLNEAWVKALPVGVLRAGLERRGLSLEGFKTDLAERLLEHQRGVYGNACTEVAWIADGVEHMRMGDVRTHLKRLGLSTTGRKHILMARLVVGLARERQHVKAATATDGSQPGEMVPAGMHEAAGGVGAMPASTSSALLGKGKARRKVGAGLVGPSAPLTPHASPYGRWQGSPYKMKKADIQAELARLGQPVHGLRSELVTRLVHARRSFETGEMLPMGAYGMFHGAAAQMALLPHYPTAPHTGVAVPATSAYLAHHPPLDLRHISDEQLTHMLASEGVHYDGSRQERESRLALIHNIKRTQAVIAQDLMRGQEMIRGGVQPPSHLAVHHMGVPAGPGQDVPHSLQATEHPPRRP